MLSKGSADWAQLDVLKDSREDLQKMLQMMEAAFDQEGNEKGHSGDEGGMAGVRVSRKNSYEESRKKYEGKNLANDAELYSYEFLTGLPDIAVSIEGNLKEATREDGSIDHALLKSKAMENAEKYGKKLMVKKV